MNHIKKIHFLPIILILAGMMLTSSCVKDKFDAPEMQTPSVDFSANTTMAGLYQYYTDSIPSGFGIIDDEIIVKGIVVANDESGNIYKTIYIEDAERGIQVSIDQTDMYTKFRLGQTIFIKCKGLYLGDYAGVLQLGYLYDGGIGRIPGAYVDEHFFPDGLPGDVPAPVLLTIPAFTNNYISMLVRLDSLYFDESGVGLPLSDPAATTDRIVKDKAGNSFILRTSNYASFAGKTVPGGFGTIIGILSLYNGEWQFYIRDADDLIGFSSSTPKVIFEETFSGSAGNFTNFSVTGSQVWGYDAAYTCMKMTGYAGTAYDNQDWLISPSIDLSQNDTVSLVFEHAAKYGTPSNYPTNLTVLVSKNYTSGDPTLAQWEQLTIPVYPSGSDWTFLGSGEVNFTSSFWGQSNVHFAFKYISTTSDASTWEVKNVKVKGTDL